MAVGAVLSLVKNQRSRISANARSLQSCLAVKRIRILCHAQPSFAASPLRILKYMERVAKEACREKRTSQSCCRALLRTHRECPKSRCI